VSIQLSGSSIIKPAKRTEMQIHPSPSSTSITVDYGDIAIQRCKVDPGATTGAEF
jgi:hypothetical protein